MDNYNLFYCSPHLFYWSGYNKNVASLLSYAFPQLMANSEELIKRKENQPQQGKSEV